MANHGYDDDFDIVDADSSWNQHDSYAMRRAPQQTAVHMTQQMPAKVAPAYDSGPALRNRLGGDASQYKRLLNRELLRDPMMV